GRECQIDRVGPQERQIGDVALVELDLHLVLVRELAREVVVSGRTVERDHVRALVRERHRVLAAPRTEVEDPLPVDVAAQPQVVFARDVGSVRDHAGGNRCAPTARDPIPSLSVGHGVIMEHGRENGATSYSFVGSGAEFATSYWPDANSSTMRW